MFSSHILCLFHFFHLSKRFHLYCVIVVLRCHILYLFFLLFYHIFCTFSLSSNENAVSTMGFLGGSLVIPGAAPVTLLEESHETKKGGRWTPEKFLDWKSVMILCKCKSSRWTPEKYLDWGTVPWNHQKSVTLLICWPCIPDVSHYHYHDDILFKVSVLFPTENTKGTALNIHRMQMQMLQLMLQMDDLKWKDTKYTTPRKKYVNQKTSKIIQ